jgi:aspartate-semialdehyde dehydrogenase
VQATQINGAAALGAHAAPAAWGAPQRSLRVQVFGAASAVGREITCALLEAGHPLPHLGLYARVPKRFAWRGQPITIEAIRETPIPVGDLAFVAASPELSPQLIAALVKRGTRVVDLSGAYRWRTDVPLVASALGREEIGAFTPFVTMACRAAAIAHRPLRAIERTAGLVEVGCTILSSAASAGAHGILALRSERDGTPNDLALGEPGPPRVGNLIPADGPLDETGACLAEAEFVWDLRRLLGRQDLPVDASVVQVDTERCDGFAFSVVLRPRATAAEMTEILAAEPGNAVAAPGTLPMPAACAGSERVHVGRIRTGSRGEASLCFFAVGDQLRLGAARSALEAAAAFPIG